MTGITIVFQSRVYIGLLSVTADWLGTCQDDRLIQRLQSVQNAAARLIFRTDR